MQKTLKLLFNQNFAVILTLCWSLTAQAGISQFMAYESAADSDKAQRQRDLHGWEGALKDFKRQLNPNKNYAIAILHDPVNAFLFQSFGMFRSTVIAERKSLENRRNVDALIEEIGFRPAQVLMYTVDERFLPNFLKENGRKNVDFVFDYLNQRTNGAITERQFNKLTRMISATNATTVRQFFGLHQVKRLKDWMDLEDKWAHELGHLQVAWSCRINGYGNDRFYGITGLTGENELQSKDMVAEGYGMSPFFATYTDGYLESSSSAAGEIAESVKIGTITWVAWEISNKDCMNGINYMDEFIKRKAYRNFSFVQDAENYKGGGCTSFGTTLLQKFGAIPRQLYDAYKVKFKVPKWSLGNTGMDLPTNTVLPKKIHTDPKIVGNHVGVLEMAFAPTWGPQVSGAIFDQELVNFSLGESMRRAKKTGLAQNCSGMNFPPRKAKGLTRNEGIVNENMHKDFARIKSIVQAIPMESRSARCGSLSGQKGMIFEN